METLVTRPVCKAQVKQAPNGPLADLVCEVLGPFAEEADKIRRTEVKSTEERSSELVARDGGPVRAVCFAALCGGARGPVAECLAPRGSAGTASEEAALAFASAVRSVSPRCPTDSFG